MKHNMFSPEVAAMRATVSNYGGPEKFRNSPAGRADSYKEQALQELAQRLELEAKVEELQKHVGMLVDRLEAADLPATFGE